tara:strand:- start:162 stop:455 length:294 start_codon:yes stop_codon:yes gene_type:complete
MENKTLKDSYKGYFLDKILNKYTDIDSKESIMEVIMFFVYGYLTLLFLSYSFGVLFTLFRPGGDAWFQNFKTIFELLLIIPSVTISIRFLRTVFTKD